MSEFSCFENHPAAQINKSTNLDFTQIFILSKSFTLTSILQGFKSPQQMYALKQQIYVNKIELE